MIHAHGCSDVHLLITHYLASEKKDAQFWCQSSGLVSADKISALTFLHSKASMNACLGWDEDACLYLWGVCVSCVCVCGLSVSLCVCVFVCMCGVCVVCAVCVCVCMCTHIYVPDSLYFLQRVQVHACMYVSNSMCF